MARRMASDKGLYRERQIFLAWPNDVDTEAGSQRAGVPYYWTWVDGVGEQKLRRQ